MRSGSSRPTDSRVVQGLNMAIGEEAEPKTQHKSDIMHNQRSH